MDDATSHDTVTLELREASASFGLQSEETMDSILGSECASGLPAHDQRRQRALEALLNLFGAKIPNPNTRQAYMVVLKQFSTWCAARGIGEVFDVKPYHIGQYLFDLETIHKKTKPSIKQNLSALRRFYQEMCMAGLLHSRARFPLPRFDQA